MSKIHILDKNSVSIVEKLLENLSRNFPNMLLTDNFN